MKFSTFASSLLLATAVSAKRYGMGYDQVKAASPGLLSGATTRLPSNPFQGLDYGTTDAYVVKLGGQLLSLVNPQSSPNVLSLAPKELSTRAGKISRPSGSTDTFNFERVHFACTIEAAGENVPVACTVLFEGFKNDLSGGSRQKIVAYDGGSSMTRADLGFENIRNIAFTVTDAGLVGGVTGVSLLLDNLLYELAPAK